MDLTNLADFKAWANVKSTADDALISSLITSQSAYFVNAINRPFAFAPTSFANERYDGNGRDTLQFKNYPVTAVSSVTVNGVSIPASPDGIRAGYVFDDTRLILIGYCFGRGRLNVALSYTAGYTTVPAEVAQAVKELCALRYIERGWTGFVSKSIQGETTMFTQKEMQNDVATVVAQYKRRVPLR